MTIDEILSLPYRNRSELASLPRDRALYFAVDRAARSVLYIGATVNLRARWSAHHRLPDLRDTPFCVAWATEPDDERRKAEETRLIQVHRPRFNRWCGVDAIRPRLTAFGTSLSPETRMAVEALARADRRSPSQMARILIEESPRLQPLLKSIKRHAKRAGTGK